MTSNGRPDYDAGDLVARIKPDATGSLRLGQVYRVAEILPPDDKGDFGVRLVGVKSGGLRDGWKANSFRRIDPKPPEFWTGTVDADAGEKVPA